MIIRIITPDERKRIEVEENDTLIKIIRDNFKYISFKARLSQNGDEIDPSYKINDLNMQDNAAIYLDNIEYEKAKEVDIKEETEASEEDSRLKIVDGKLIRKKDKLLCTHDSSAMCINCAPLEVYDKMYHLKNKIKYLSYNAYLKQGLKEEKNQNQILCNHLPTEKCMNCMNKVITLQVQRYRRIDHVEIHCKNELNHFFMLFSQTKKHRVAFLLGYYTDYDFVPLGRKAVVKTLYYPEQKNFPDGFILLEREKDDLFFNLEMVGVILTSTNEEYIINNLQLFFIKNLQSKNKNLVTLILKNEEIEEYMVSDLMIDLHDKITPCSNPRVFKTFIDCQYREGEIIKREKYVPVEYFVVKLTHGFKDNSELFVSDVFLEKNCGMKKLNKYFNNEFNERTLSNYELVSRLSKEMDVTFLCKAIKKKDKSMFNEFINSNDFKKFINKLKEFDEEWKCNVCTYLNTKMGEFCEICNSKRISA